jgi:hypothetical protein
MKTLFLIFVAAMAAFSQELAKVDPKATTPAAKPAERPLTKEEVLTFRATMAEIKNLRAEFRIDEYEKKIKVIANEQQTAATDMCLSVGVPKELVQTQCGITTGLDENGQPLNGPDGKPITPKVFWNKPTAEKK